MKVKVIQTNVKIQRWVLFFLLFFLLGSRDLSLTYSWGCLFLNHKKNPKRTANCFSNWATVRNSPMFRRILPGLSNFALDEVSWGWEFSMSYCFFEITLTSASILILRLMSEPATFTVTLHGSLDLELSWSSSLILGICSTDCVLYCL